MSTKSSTTAALRSSPRSDLRIVPPAAHGHKNGRAQPRNLTNRRRPRPTLHYEITVRTKYPATSFPLRLHPPPQAQVHRPDQCHPNLPRLRLSPLPALPRPHRPRPLLKCSMLTNIQERQLSKFIQPFGDIAGGVLKIPSEGPHTVNDILSR